MSSEKIILASDHAGFILKQKIKDFLSELNYEVYDFGVHNSDSVDYPLIAREAALKVADGEYNKGIFFCGSGVGMSICANKVKGIRSVVCSDTTSAKFSRLHNDANVLCLGQRIVGEYLAADICKIWLDTQFEAQRHLRRVNLIEN